jgi:NAD(P)H-dependent FMN reductase
MKVLLFAGSLRKDSLNKKMILHVQKYLSSKLAIDATVIDLRPLHFPVYDGDIEALSIPEGVNMLGRFISDADAVIISSPEYNGSISSPGAPGALGAIRALGHARAPFEAMGSFVYPQSFGLAKAHEAFTAEGALITGANQERLEKLLNSFIEPS